MKTKIRVERIQPSEIPTAAAVLSYAFLTQPNYIAIWHKQDESTRQMYKILFGNHVLSNQQKNYTLAARQENQIVGVLNMAKWPHCQPSFLETLGNIPQTLTLLNISQIFMLIEGAIFRGSKALSELSKHHPQQTHWYLGPIGVLPQLQGQGIGSQMLEKCCEIIDQQKTGAYLDTDKQENVHFYERYGFTVTGQIQILGVTNWFMWRSPR